MRKKKEISQKSRTISDLTCLILFVRIEVSNKIMEYIMGIHS